MPRQLERLYEGKAKRVYRTDDPDLYLVEYKDDATAFNGAKKGTIQNKGVLNNQISGVFFRMLEERGIPTHFVELVSDREMLVKTLEIVPVEVVVRNIAAGSLAKRLGLAEGTVLSSPVLEYYYKSDELGDPMINDYHIRALGLASPEQMERIRDIALAVNSIMLEYLADKNIDLVDFKLEFGIHKGAVILGDEISPDTCRFWDKHTREKLDKDRFRRDLGNVEGAYEEVFKRLTGKSFS
ncbi:Phosphoribosylaminoimidazole-succinocarboxamide synthase [Pelotomaculum schinkii]|uniref:Phosphoribosylaminoimidazole-succinocarboxamide synthase n=1 Tax=Pelotomaculum schinkii TaxID=78350 RepID=A0A4Y7R7N5_9FIRM|nr:MULTISPECIES: phosphoribosylaminoimidazolesuccinocarboxamide synthase [Pelotomaculum]TEB04640.1 Phosphoribosylaminoimidazole-succinocarboxamide synthase [Pelotomaculum schinkii]TEB16147.1 Phosphoribosylaminoimidazole-succinocarboxamide synthase [Pelotomaculum sp. FP]